MQAQGTVLSSAAATWAPAAIALLTLIVRRIFAERERRWEHQCRIEEIRMGLDPDKVEGPHIVKSA
jgi:hypothetical protein